MPVLQRSLFGLLRAGLSSPTLLLAALLTTACAGSARADAGDFERARLGSGRYATLEGVLKRTLWRVEVARVELRVDRDTQRELAAIAGGRAYSDELAEQAVAAIMDGDTFELTTVLRRDVPFDRYLDAVYRNLDHAESSGLIARATYHAIAWLVPDWLADLEDRDLREGDTLVCSIGSSSMRVRYETTDGNVIVDRSMGGAAPGRAVLASHLADGSSFREPLLKSLFR